VAFYSNDGLVRIQHVSSIANIAAPTAAELNAGTNVTTFVPKDGLTTPANQNFVDNSSLADTFDAQNIGSEGGNVTLVGKRNNTGDTLWNLITRGLAGFLVVRRGITASSTFAATQPVEVYPVEYHDPVMDQTATNTQARFAVNAAVTAQPNRKAVVA